MTIITIPCCPVAQPRQRVRVVAGRPQNYTPTDSPVNSFKATARMAWASASQAAPLSGPVALYATFILAKPKGRNRGPSKGERIWCDRKPDLDNLLKSLMDALTGLAWEDDKQIVDLRSTKLYADKDESPHVDVCVMAANDLFGGDVDG